MVDGSQRNIIGLQIPFIRSTTLQMTKSWFLKSHEGHELKTRASDGGWGLIGYLASTNDTSFENMKRAIIYGSAMASYCVEKFDPNHLFELDQKAIDGRVQDFIDLVEFEIDY